MKISVPVVCILTAGKGTRMGTMGRQLNKALFPIGGKALITQIISKFPIDAEFVIALGFLGEQVKNYLQIAHQGRSFTFVGVDNFDSVGSGPGYSLLCCREHLQQSFYFVSCDTLWDNSLNFLDTGANWLGVANVSSSTSASYCNLKVVDGHVVELRDKVQVTDSSFQAFVGLCFIRDFSVFWDALDNTKVVAGEHQVSNGIKALIENTDVCARPIEWIDVGDQEKYKQTVSLYENFDFSKQNEALYIVNRKVIKFFVDPVLTQRRVEKARLNSDVFPSITHHTGQFYAYDYQPGETLYQVNNQQTFRKLLEWLSNELWQSQSVNTDVMRATCKKFYLDKTLERLEIFRRKYDYVDETSWVNGHEIPPTNELLDAIPWSKLFDGIPCFIHGDLQFDNILFDADINAFKLLDWRQDFGGHVEFGDLYYDLAKLYGGIVLNYDYIKLNLLNYSENEDGIFFDFGQRYQKDNYLKILKQFVEDRGYDFVKVRLLVALIYLNMSPLHHYPFDKMLYSLGRELLNIQVQELERTATNKGERNYK